jgi:hypothetical protein
MAQAGPMPMCPMAESSAGGAMLVMVPFSRTVGGGARKLTCSARQRIY